MQLKFSVLGWLKGSQQRIHRTLSSVVSIERKQFSGVVSFKYGIHASLPMLGRLKRNTKELSSRFAVLGRLKGKLKT